MPLRCALFVALLLFTTAAACSDLEGFPESLDGKHRQVIRLPRVVDESRFMVELVPGKNEMVDCNLRGYHATLERETLSGWGYGYYVLGEPRPAPSTLKACPEGSEARRFVRVRGDGLLVRYNSQRPLVVYLPEGFELKYRVWRADKTLSDAHSR